jgi:hypothetical protein
MDHFRLNKLKEEDVDSLISACGGSRVVVTQSGSPSPSADYLLQNAVIELKLLEEEGLQKESRQKKLSDLFRKNFPDRPVIVLDPDLLPNHDRQRYYNILEGPIKTQVKKAAKQLEATASQHDSETVRLLLAINNGYTAFSHDELLSRVVKCVRSDTSRIDGIIVAGCYYYSDKFEYFFLAPIDFVLLNSRTKFKGFPQFRMEWNALIGNKLTSTIRGEEVVDNLKSPVLDIVFETDGVKFVKPSPPIGGESSATSPWRRRANTTTPTSCPPVALTFPQLCESDWRKFKKLMPQESIFKTTYGSWKALCEQPETEVSNTDKIYVPVSITYDDYYSWQKSTSAPVNFKSVNIFACKQFEIELRQLILSASQLTDEGMLYPRFALLRAEEIGQDNSLDVCSIYLCSTLPGLEREELIVRLNTIFEHGKALAAAHAIKRGLPAVKFEIDKTYCWH